MVTNSFNQPFAEQLAFFRQKINLPTERWDDVKKSAHDRAFVVAGANKADLLDDLRKIIDQCIAEGKSLGWYQKNFEAIVQKHGWTGWTGEGTKAGRDWRTTITYQTNMSVSYHAGRWEQLHDPELVKMMPYLTYHHADGVRRPRPIHQSWNGFTAPRDHEFWQTHAAPNGWRCHCYISGADESDYATAKAAGKHKPPAGWQTINPKTGEPVGIDKGFGYAPGANRNTPLRSFVQDKLISYPPAITRALSKDVNRYINAQDDVVSFVTQSLADNKKVEPLWVGFVENNEEIFNAVKQDTKGYMVLIPAQTARHVRNSHGFDGGSQRPPIPKDFAKVWEVLAKADSLSEGEPATAGAGKTIVAWKKFGDENYRCVFDVLHGKKNRALVLQSMLIKTK
ncbi:MAG: phage minor head protein [Sideroxydans sp.]|nr:phage minor head protein [Sideroxydans sp.]